jgi:hypothetical protein
MGSDDVRPFSQVARAKGTPQSDGTLAPMRLSQYGEQYVAPAVPWRHALSDEGSYHVFHNATNDAATTLAGHAAPVLADADATMTKPFLFFRNLLSTGRRIYFDYIEIEVVTAGASATQACWAAQLDTGTTRVLSGGTALTVLNSNGQSVNALDSTAFTALGGAITTGTESSAVRDLGFGTFRPSIEIAGDKKIFVFGADPLDTATTAAGSVRTQIQAMPPVVLGFTDQLLLALHGQASQTAAGVYKVRGACWVR